jgi:uncharacterized membrane protein YbjE (DUF340 family)
MKHTGLIILFFTIGLLLGLYASLPESISGNKMTLYTLYLLLFLVGIGVGSTKNILKLLRSVSWRIFLIPGSVIFGTFMGTFVYAMLDSSLSLRSCWAVGAGFGYYSLTGVLVKEIAGEGLGIIALLSNLLREVLTLIFTPLLAKYFDKTGPVSAGGATTMDTTLPVITRYIGTEYVAISVFSGMILSLLVPFIVPWVLGL